MTWPFDDSDLPLHDGVDVGGAQERSMAQSVGGYQGIRTVEELNPDGSMTRLRTRWGRPIFETDPVRASSSSQKYRGFVAKASSRAVLFDPYTLTVLDANYTPALNTYSVQDFATSWNVPLSDTTDWYDVVMFDGQTIKVNAKAMPTLGIVANQSFQAIPYVINRNDASDQYGNAERNATEKRVFAVGRSDVQSWGGGGVIETLTPSTPRADNKAMTIGPRVDQATEKAILGQLYFTGAVWNEPTGTWQFTDVEVTMMLASPYLSSLSSSATVDQTTIVLATPATTGSSPIDTPVTRQSTGITLTGVGEVSGSFNYTVDDAVYVNWPWSGIWSSTLDGRTEGTDTYRTYYVSDSATILEAGKQLDYVCSNTKTISTKTTQERVDAQNKTTPVVLSGATDAQVDNASDVLVLTGNSVSNGPGNRGTQTIYISNTVIPNSSATKVTETQVCTASVKIASEALVDIEFSTTRVDGTEAAVYANNDWFNSYLADPYGLIGAATGLGVGNRLWIHAASGLSYYKNPSGYTSDMSQPIKDEISAFANAQAASYAGTTFYSILAAREPHYGSVINPVSSGSSYLDVETRDYILYDDVNGVYITVIGTISGTQTRGGSASCVVTVKIEVRTRHHVVMVDAYTYNYSVGTLLPEKVINTTTDYAAPTPKIRAIFTPLYREQGSFKGAHYITEEEENNGATAAHLFNFLLNLKPYGDLATVNDDNITSTSVHFVPCNMLEMLYAFVFSQEYGVAAVGAGSRYPVTFTTRFNDIMSTLFTNAIRVSVRDGVQGNWSDVFGTDFASIPNVSLHRT